MKTSRKPMTYYRPISKDEKARMLYDAREAELRDELTRMMSSEAKGTAKTICLYLDAKFGTESQVLQERVHARSRNWMISIGLQNASSYLLI